MMQLSVLKIIGYGPWTLTLGSDREHRLQMLQASVYGEVQRLFSERGCLVFSNRSDELFVISSGLDLEGHIAIQDALHSKFDDDIRLQIAMGRGSTPADCDRAAHAAVSEGAALSRQHQIFGAPACGGQNRGDEVTVMHMDVDGLSGRSSSPYGTSLLMSGIYRKMSEYFYRDHESLAFFMGGDNFMIAASDQAKTSGARRFVDMIARQDDIQLNCGVGTAATGRQAAMLATESLDMIREMRDGPTTPPGASDESAGRAGNGDLPRVYEHSTGNSF